MKAYSIYNVLTAKFDTLDFDGEWKEAVGLPERSGTWFIYGAPKNGKTSFAMQLSKYLSRFGRVLYNSIEEGFSLSIRRALERERLAEAGGRILLVQKDVEEMITFLRKRRSPEFVVIDSIQFMELTFHEYKRIKSAFSRKVFIYISHVEGRIPDGVTARKIWRDAGVAFRVEGFRAFVSSRYGGGHNAWITISEERAAAYWGV